MVGAYESLPPPHWDADGKDLVQAVAVALSSVRQSCHILPVKGMTLPENCLETRKKCTTKLKEYTDL